MEGKGTTMGFLALRQGSRGAEMSDCRGARRNGRTAESVW